MKKIYLLMIMMFALAGMGLGQTTLSAGDIAIYAINTDNADAFGFVPLVDLQPNTTINFTDNGINSDGSIRSGEGTLTWTTTSTVSKGTAVTWEGGTWSTGSSTGNAPAFSGSGDQCIAYTGSESSPTFIYALNIANSGWITSGTPSSNTSYLPPGLTNGTNAIHVSSQDNGYYSGTTTGSASELLSYISDNSNWTTSNTRIDLSNWPSSFTITGGSSNDQTTEVYAPTTQISGTTISSLDDTQGEAVDVFKMTIEDQASGDGLPTHVTNIRVQPYSTNTADWTNTIQGVTLNDGSAVTIGTPTITDTYIDIPITSGNLDVADGASKDVTLAVYLNTSNIVDGSVLSFKVTAASHGFTADASGSGFASSFALGDFNSEDFTIDVDATKLSFIQQPGNTIVNTVMSPAVLVAYTDANGNTDVDYDGAGFTIGLTTTGTFDASSTTSVDAVNGVSTFDNLIFSATGTGITITANDNSGMGISSATSNSFDVNEPEKLIISEVADPGDNTDARFVELYNAGSSNIDLSSGTWYLSRQANGNPTSWADIALTGTLRTGETYLISYGNDNSNFNSAYGFNPENSNGGITGNGDDGYFLYKGGDHTTGTLVDAYGVIDEDGTGKPWEYKDSHAVRNSSVTQANATWTASEWDITSANVANMTPGTHGDCITFNGSSTSVWGTAGNWVGRTAPTSSENVKVPAGLTNNPSVDGDAATPSECNNLTIASGASLTIPAGKALTVHGNLTNNATAADLVIQSDATGTGSLIVNGTVTGSATVQQYITQYSTNYDGWHFLSAPVSGFTIAGSDFEPVSGQDDLYRFDESVSTGNWLNYNGGTFGETEFQVGEGYLVAYQTTATKSFTGTLTTGDQSAINLSYTSASPTKVRGWNLLGNPFTSAIDWDLITKSGSVDASVYVVRASDGAYISWNGSTGSLTDGIIPAMQGYFVLATATGQTVTVDAADQVHDATNFYKSSSNLAENTLMVQVNGNNGQSEAYIQFRSDATETFDHSCDAYKLFGYSAAPQIYTNDGETLYSINCLPDKLKNYDLPLGVKISASGNYEISFQGVENVSNSFKVYFEDLKTGNNFEVKPSTKYNFTASEGNDANRFLLHFYNITSTPEIQGESQKALIYAYDHSIIIKANSGNLSGTVEVTNALGQTVAAHTVSGVSFKRFAAQYRPGVYVIRYKGNDGYVQTQKVVIN